MFDEIRLTVRVPFAELLTAKPLPHCMLQTTQRKYKKVLRILNEIERN